MRLLAPPRALRKGGFPRQARALGICGVPGGLLLLMADLRSETCVLRPMVHAWTGNMRVKYRYGKPLRLSLGQKRMGYRICRW